MFLILFSLLFVFQHCSASSCQDRKSCCSYWFNHELCKHESPDCSCKSSCRYLSNCCNDFRSFCMRGPPVPCIYTEWGSWGECTASNNTCDVGIQVRRRDVAQMGNYKTSFKCHKYALKDVRSCGNPDCYRYEINRRTNPRNIYSQRSYYNRALFLFNEGNGDCEEFTPHDTLICALCTDRNRCGQDAIPKGNIINIDYKSCSGKWTKYTNSNYRIKCSRSTPHIKTYIFTDKSNS